RPTLPGPADPSPAGPDIKESRGAAFPIYSQDPVVMLSKGAHALRPGRSSGPPFFSDMSIERFDHIHLIANV
ncbi:hypothetical protein, partial [Mesorhizobium sp.]|uniref:hypothetical protein n=1 Tax=Mesorhizobium sp. TaxID=1871066 RepID=UPI0025C461E6